MVTALSAGGNQPIVVQTLGQPTLQSAIPQAIQVLPIGSLGNLQVMCFTGKVGNLQLY